MVTLAEQVRTLPNQNLSIQLVRIDDSDVWVGPWIHRLCIAQDQMQGGRPRAKASDHLPTVFKVL